MKVILIILIALLSLNCESQKNENYNSDSKSRISEEDTISRSKIVGRYKAVVKNTTDTSNSIRNIEFSTKYYYDFSLPRTIVEKYEIDINKIIIRYKRGSNQEFKEEKIVYEIMNDNALLDKETNIRYLKY